ncbi:SH3 domain-containing protein [Microlunatus elymi]|uniref:SH3 domain-containing protein n=1 Tax=Microlunatus elymi TaxID=2596828 RepID=A0A516Q4T3_9ACTN|nr:SH3 domain-containing protein [Microlunatus elymi]QDP98385.1 SH3 domain-containing protein [Microlunatus elymi]
MSSAMRKAGAVTSLLAAAGAAITVGGVQLASADSVTATAGVNIRSGPGTKYAIVGGLTAGQRITAVGKPTNGWIKVRFNGDTAYVSAAYLDLKSGDTSPGPANIYTKGTKIATAPLNVRQGASLGSKVIGYIAAGQNVTLTGKQSAGFAEMLYGGQRAWVSGQYLVSSMNALPKKTGARYATADLLIRTSTDSDFNIITTVKKGTRLQATGVTRSGYAQIVYNSAIRWVTAKYLSTQPVSSAPASNSGTSSSGPAKQTKPATSHSNPAKTSGSTSGTSKADPSKTGNARPTTPAVPKVVGSRYATTELLIRTTSGSDFKTVAEVPRGARLQITGATANGKAQVVYGGVARWVTAQYLSTSKPKAQTSRPVTPALPRVVGTRYATTELLIRTTSGSNYKTVDTVPTRTKLKITGTYANGRAQIVYNGAVRWVTSQYLAKSKPASRSSSGGSSSVGLVGSNTSSNKGKIALNYAKAQLGKPYVWGAEGPNSFDCSGLTLRAWQAAGVNLPRTSQQQFLASPRVSMSNLKVGDLVFFYGPSPSHVGIYAGNGKVINAPRPGKVVEYTPIAYMPVAGATRPG